MVINICPICGHEHLYAVGTWEGRYIIRKTYCDNVSGRRQIKIDTRLIDGYAPAVAIYHADKSRVHITAIDRTKTEQAKPEHTSWLKRWLKREVVA